MGDTEGSRRRFEKGPKGVIWANAVWFALRRLRMRILGDGCRSAKAQLGLVGVRALLRATIRWAQHVTDEVSDAQQQCLKAWTALRVFSSTLDCVSYEKPLHKTLVNIRYIIGPK